MPCRLPIPEGRQKNGPGRANLPGSLHGVRRRLHVALHIRAMVVALVCFVLPGCSTVPTAYHPSSPIPPASVSHALWDALVRAHVANGVVNYPALAKDKRFGDYLNQLNHVDPQAFSTHPEQLAFWINAYNAFAAKGIIDQYSPKSLWGKYRYFIGREYSVGGASLNLYDLEHDILIPQFKEPRVHFAIVCASASCPKLQSWAYQPSELDRQLDHAAREFINDPTRNRFDREKRVAHLSMIFNWFSEDFIAHSGSLIQYLKPHLNDAALVKELEMTPYRVEFMEYDWSVNGIPPKDE